MVRDVPWCVGHHSEDNDITNTPFVASLNTFMDHVYLIMFVPLGGGEIRSLMCVGRPAVLNCVVFLNPSTSNSGILGRTLKQATTTSFHILHSS